MRRLMTCALSLVLSAALIGPVGAETSGSAQKQASAAAAAASEGLDPDVSVPQAAVDVASSEAAPVTQNAAPLATAAVQVAAQGPAPDEPGSDIGSVAAHAVQPASPFSDLLMWGAPSLSTVTKSGEGLSAHATHTIQRLTAGILDRTRTIVAKITESAMQFIGTPYSFGGTSAAGFDCSGYVQHIFAMVGISLPRTADQQYLVGKHITVAEAKRGDLVFFQTYTAGVSHVGIYLGNDEFIHSSSSHGVTVSSMHDAYWSSHLVGVERIVGSDRVGVVASATHV